MRRTLGTALLLTTLALPAGAQHRGDLISTARNAGRFATLLAALDAANLTQTLRSGGPYTVLAPTDEAFARLPEGTVESLLKPENRDQLRQILLYHVIPGRANAATVRTLEQATTVEGRPVRIRATGGSLRVNGATVVTADVEASNGVIHVIDRVLLPADAEARSESRSETPDAGARNGAPARTMSPDVGAARELLALAVRRGAPLYNDGAPGATVAVYEVAARGALALGGLPAAARAVLERGLRDADRERDLDERAWVLRRALDDASRALDGRRMMSAALP